MPQSRRLQAPVKITRPRQIPGLLGNARRHQTGQADVLVGPTRPEEKDRGGKRYTGASLSRTE